MYTYLSILAYAPSRNDFLFRLFGFHCRPFQKTTKKSISRKWDDALI